MFCQGSIMVLWESDLEPSWNVHWIWLITLAYCLLSIPGRGDNGNIPITREVPRPGRNKPITSITAANLWKPNWTTIRAITSQQNLSEICPAVLLCIRQHVHDFATALWIHLRSSFYPPHSSDSTPSDPLHLFLLKFHHCQLKHFKLLSVGKSLKTKSICTCLWEN